MNTMNEQDYNAALDAWEAMLAQAYLQQASELVGDISLAQITAMIAAGDDLALVQSLEKLADYTPTLEAMRSAYLAGAQDESSAFFQRHGRLRAYGNAIAAPAAQAFIEAVMSSL